MWTPPIALTPEEQTMVTRTRKTRQFFGLLRERRHELLDTDFQHTLAQSARAAPGGKAPVEAGRLALATRGQASCHVGERDAVERTVMEKRWQLGRDGLGAEPPPCSQGPLYNFRMRLIAPNLDKLLLARTGALAEQTGGFGARPLRAALDSTPRCGAGRVEDTLNLLGQALRTAVALAAAALGLAAAAVVEAAGLTLGGPGSRKAALDLDGGEVARWPCWLTPPPPLAAPPPPLQAVMETLTPRLTQATEPDPGGGPGGRRLTPHVAPDRRSSIEEHARRHGRKSSAKTCNGFPEHCAVDGESTVTRDVVVRPAHEPEHAMVERLAVEWEHAPGLLQLDMDLGARASPRRAPGAEQGVDISARPWPQGGSRCTKAACPLDFAGMLVTWSGGPECPHDPRQGCPVAGDSVCRVCLARPVPHSHPRTRQKREHPRG